MPLAKFSISTALVLASWVLVASAPPAAAGETAEQTFERALDRCMTVPRGQRSFCRHQAQADLRVNRAREQKRDEVIRYDYDASNDTPAQAAAKQAWLETTDKCASMNRDARIACMDDAWVIYQAALGSK